MTTDIKKQQTTINPPSNGGTEKKLTYKVDLKKRFKASKYLLILFLPCLIFYIVFKYLPMWGIVISFFDYNSYVGLAGSEFVGLDHFRQFFSSPEAVRTIKNTVVLGLQQLIFGFPVPIIFALLLNEVTGLRKKKLVQTISYMPHFLSMVVVCGMLYTLLSPVGGVVNNIIQMFGGETINFLAEEKYFRLIYVVSGIWQEMGWGAIIYMAALAGIDSSLYEAAAMDGASRFKQITQITLPSLAPTIITMLLLRVGSVLSVGLEKALLLQKPVTFAVSDVIDTYVYRQGMVSGNLSYATAVGLFNSVVCLILLFAANAIAKRFSESNLF